ncbi:hypothetical protein CAL14_14630 [Bordetella genomosp. 9]|uniref:elongation factor P maturation arginine rhamnosyltransferase EarP n=1 Tax=Bordetella genomosp. 9 TaxID=1416803 RepID=UPI000A29118B|nr:elongation factor P maturation arginine rhamnosyltransferase EarP [Bordetella genomosp. 9]ARP91370.1 hypothetical protein CAL14_14630 [Bordetella genomosp. 9]
MHADIFCKRVDNYGDIGVCWRLARRLRQAAGWRIRLWIDDLGAFARMAPDCDPARAMQEIGGVEIIHWTPEPARLMPGDVVIEAFACDPPEDFRAAMRARRPVWINLEYLSAEPWVESCHKLPSPQPDGLMKYFFFPGFTPATGGLLREPDIAARRDGFQRDSETRRAFLAACGVPEIVLDRWQAPSIEDTGGDGRACRGRARLATLFCYPTAPLDALLAALRTDVTPTVLLVPEGVAPGLASRSAGLAGHGGMACENLDGAFSHVEIIRIPFLSQDDYDRLLWCADINFVRGEDSLVRGSWAARPLVWQIYPQSEDVHLDKLDAWLDRYLAPREAQDLIRLWNTEAAPAAMAQAWRQATAPGPFQAWTGRARSWDAELAAMPELADELAEFCAEIRRKC